MKKTTSKPVQKMETDKCLNPICDRLAAQRGLCQSCYQSARLLVVTSRSSWQELEDAGKCKPVKTAGRNKGTIGWLLSKT